MIKQLLRVMRYSGLQYLAFLLTAVPILAQAQSRDAVKTIILVHGAFADATSWSKVIPILEADGYHVVAVQNPLISLTEDVAATRRAVALQDGPVSLVGHSWGGVVITQAGDDPKVVGLVYVSAYAPEASQSANDASAPFGWTDGQKQIRVNGDGFATVTSEGMLENIADSLPMAERKRALAVPGQSYGPMFDEKLTVAAWKSKPTWAIVSTKDRMLPPAMEESAAKRMGAVTTIVATCHMSILQDPATVAAVIDEAARNAISKQSEIEKANAARQGQ